MSGMQREDIVEKAINFWRENSAKQNWIINQSVKGTENEEKQREAIQNSEKLVEAMKMKKTNKVKSKERKNQEQVQIY